jgi:hydroxymethylpyrimidine pyrophosphatase-like HAD family hydrolase
MREIRLVATDLDGTLRDDTTISTQAIVSRSYLNGSLPGR